uniref:Uncharacterized protein n=1 Tax=Chaetoceros debilis TaxID=122233 RepID=A0A7S3Q8V2_9STRA
MDVHYHYTMMFIIALCAFQATHTLIPVHAFHVSSPSFRTFEKRATATTTALNAFNLKKKFEPQPEVKSVPRIAVKPRPLVSLDEKSGRYIPPPKEVLSVSSSSHDKSDTISYGNEPDGYDYYESMSGWSTFKDGIYGVVDIVKGLRREKTVNSITDRTLEVAYTDTVGDSATSRSETAASIRKALSFSSPTQTPGSQLLEKYEKSLKTKTKSSEFNDSSISTGENLFTTESRKTFNSVKDTLYDTADSLKKKKKENKPKPEATSTSTSTSYKVPTKPSFNEEVSVKLISSNLEGITSNNPIKRFKAQRAIAIEERKRQSRLQREERKQTFDNLKQMVFNFVESLQVMYQVILSIPSEVEKAIDSTQYSIATAQTQIQDNFLELQKAPAKIETFVQESKRTTLETVETVQAIPGQVEKQIVDTKEGIVKAVEDVQAIPGNIERKINETKKSIEETRQGVENFVQKIEDITFDAKVLAGLEKARPPPPPPPPPPKTAQDIAIGVAGEAAKLAGKSAVVVATGTVGMGVAGAKIAWGAASNEITKNREKQQRLQVVSLDKIGVQEQEESIAIAKAVSAVTAVDRPQTMAEIDPLLEKEVREALRVAEEALSATENSATTSVTAPIRSIDGIPTMDINEAVKKAKEAAFQARRDANDLEAMLMERKLYGIKDQTP